MKATGKVWRWFVVCEDFESDPYSRYEDAVATRERWHDLGACNHPHAIEYRRVIVTAYKRKNAALWGLEIDDMADSRL